MLHLSEALLMNTWRNKKKNINIFLVEARSVNKLCLLDNPTR